MMQEVKVSVAAAGKTRTDELASYPDSTTSTRFRPLLEALTGELGSEPEVCGCALFLVERGGHLRLLDNRGNIDLTIATRLAHEHCERPIAGFVQDWYATVLMDGRRRIGVLICHLLEERNPDSSIALRAALSRTASLLAQRLTDVQEVERLHLALSRLAEAEKLQRALYRIADLASGEREMYQVLTEIHHVVADLAYAENFFIALYDSENELLTLPYFRDEMDSEKREGGVFPASQWEGSLTLEVLRSGEILMGPSEQLQQERELPQLGYGPHSADWLGVPMLHAGTVIGVLVVQSYDPARRYSDKDRALLTFVAQHVATALQRLRAHEELERRVEERTAALHLANAALRNEVHERKRAEKLQKALYRIAELGSRAGGLDEFYVELHAVIGELIVARNFYIALLRDDGQWLDFPYSADERDRDRHSRRLGAGLTEHVLHGGTPLLADSNQIRELERRGELHMHGCLPVTWLGVPLIHEGQAVGVMAIQSYDADHLYDRRDQDLLIFVSYHVINALQRKRHADSLREANASLERRVLERTEELASINTTLREQIAERERAEQRLRHAVLHDALTGLPNRTLLLDRMGKALKRYRSRKGADLAVLFLDLDRFKVVNDSVGHLVGDELLKVAGNRIQSQLPPAALIARLGGDEFAILLENDAVREEAPMLAERIIMAMESPLRLVGKDVYSSVSVGIAFVQPHYHTAEELLRDADAALYRAKAKGRHRYEVFDAKLRREVLLQVELEESLRRALARREFEPVFQPIFDLHSGRVVGFEALMRWRHPRDGLLAPARFLRQAEESGLSEAIDWQVFEIAFAQAGVLVGRSAYLGINVDARHLRDAPFVDNLLRRLDAAGFNPDQLRVEITESVLLEDPVQSRNLMERLRRHGIRIALDDFGTGYSSLSYLHQFPLHALKIDRSFIAPLGGQANDRSAMLLRAIHTLGTQLELEVIAEGIETRAQLDHVKGLGAVCGQGFLLARPASVHALLAAGCSVP